MEVYLTKHKFRDYQKKASLGACLLPVWMKLLALFEHTQAIRVLGCQRVACLRKGMGKCCIPDGGYDTSSKF
ncbi:hypothetical protein COCNU_02G011470 [Cocos nucifera]|uniref:Uncharacterized protein n=1 Tax=Cocos nucifera TaxID=13894 RepID=A0A8K0HZS8_COCNU|nr:hypothetical protein COCNU_02G011470 [Cocos nucifera]